MDYGGGGANGSGGNNEGVNDTGGGEGDDDNVYITKSSVLQDKIHGNSSITFRDN